MPTPRQIERRQRVLRISRELFAQQGYQETTLDQIAKQARIGKGIIYRYFGNKEDLLVAVFADSIEQIQNAGKAYPPVIDGDPGARVRYIFENYLRQIEEQREIFSFFGKILLGLPSTPWGQGLRKDFLTRYLEIALRRKDELQAMMQAGVANPMDPEKLLFLILGALHGAIGWWIHRGCPPGLVDEAEALTQFVLHGILTPEGKAATAVQPRLPKSRK